MTYPAVTPDSYYIEPEDPHADELEAVMEEIASDDETLFQVLKDADWTARIEDVIREAAENRIANRKQLDAEDRGERLHAAANDYY